MKEHVLGGSDRAALQSLIPLAGALGAGTIFALFFGGRRRGSGIAVFELFAIVSVLAAAGTTAYLCIALLHRNAPISDHELSETATPLLVAAMLLIFVSVFARLPGTWERILAILPLAIGGAVIAALLASSTWTATPENASLVALVILGVGGLLAFCAWAVDRLDIGWDRRTQYRRFARLSAAGYLVAEKKLRLAMPRADTATEPRLSCWTRKGRTYLDSVECRRLGDEAGTRWHQLAESRARPPRGSAVLGSVKVSIYIPGLTRRPSARLSIFEPATGGESRTLELEANEDNLFDITDLDLV